MRKVLITYLSSTGNTGKMAQYISEGVRFGGHEAVIKKIEDIKESSDLSGYDGYIIGSPTYSHDLPEAMKTFISTLKKEDLESKLGGAFGPYSHDVSYQHDDYAPAIIFTTLQQEYDMRPFSLGPFNLKEDIVDTSEGIKTCQDYGKVFSENLGN